ncbi:MAG TPA: hypothetical protein VLA34_07050 [Candidatus Krumholzibacterium sp.]|nr:hypothetical protein [Candidatus Krumholzibacterium sp.]
MQNPIRDWAPNDPRWLIPGGLFTLLVVGLLVWLHVFGEIQVEGTDLGLQYDGVLYTESMPDSVPENLKIADERLPENLKFPRDAKGELAVQWGGASQMCKGSIDGEEVEFLCEPGWITVVLWDAKMASCTGDACEAGMAFWDPTKRTCTIMLPPTTEDALPLDALTAEEPVDLPLDIDAMVLAHEAVHCRRGSPGHAFTGIFGPFYSIPTGHLMHPNTLKMGWRTEGL